MQGRGLLPAAMVMAAVVVTGCGTTTRIASFGPLPGGMNLVTLIVSEDLDVVKTQCAGVAAHGRVMGCQIASPVKGLSGALLVRTIKIVRYAERAPSPVTFEIDAHELCHAIASLQFLKDPCHEGNGGVLQAVETAGGLGVGNMKRVFGTDVSFPDSESARARTSTMLTILALWLPCSVAVAALYSVTCAISRRRSSRNRPAHAAHIPSWASCADLQPFDARSAARRSVCVEHHPLHQRHVRQRFSKSRTLDSREVLHSCRRKKL
jgi:hypothetical protein